MLRADLIDIVNKGNVWAFVGSGASIDAGLPSWRVLLEKVVQKLEESTGSVISKDDRYQRAFSKHLYPQCFERIENIAGRNELEEAVKVCLEAPRALHHSVMQRLAEWPFAAYITTNYDTLLESSLREIGQLSWLPVGNSPDEVRKVAGDATQVIWHLHGVIELPPEKARLVLTEKDYDDLYLESSLAVSQLRGLLAQRRIVFIGFGFADPEVMRLIKLVGRYCNPARPAFAFLSGVSGGDHESERIELLEKYNVDVIPYNVVDGSHEQLAQLLDVYGSLILRRTLRFGQPERPCPSYDPETTSLLVYNHLALRDQAGFQEDLLGTILRSRILSLLKYRGPLTFEELNEDLSERVRLVHGGKSLGPEDRARVLALIGKNLKALVAGGFVEVQGTSTKSTAALTASGSELLATQAGTAARLSDQFSASLRDRASQICPDNQGTAGRIALATESFLKSCINRRALGVAMVWNSPTLEFKQYHMVGLLQTLPDFMTQLGSPNEGSALVRLVQDVLARPTEAETRFLGVALQAQFGMNLLGYDPQVVQARARNLVRTLFLIDSSTLIPFLGRSSVGHYSARLLLDKVSKAGAAAATTKFFSIEVAEHARWAKQHIGAEATPLTTRSLITATGRAGSSSNVFVEGFLEEVNGGRMTLDFGAYLNSVCGHPNGSSAHDDAFVVAIQNVGVPCLGLEEWEGFSDSLWSERDQLQELIAERRKVSKTYRHERQVKAEAEALIIIRKLRGAVFKINGKTCSNAHFISNTRVIENLTGPELPVTMRPEAVLQWLSTITVCDPKELGFLVNGLLWELSERQLAIVDKQRLKVFSPLTVASREKLEEELLTHSVLVAQRYGENASQAFNEISPLEVPVVLESYSVQKAEDLEQRMAQQQKRMEVLQSQAKLNEKERRELEELRTHQRFRKRKAQSKKRSAASRTKGKRKNR